MLPALSFVLGLLAQNAPFQTSPAQPDTAAARYEVSLWTIDQGAAVWERFGHNALLIRDRTTGEELAWNWGLFDFSADDFLVRFLRGSMEYSMGPFEPGALLASYVAADRTVYSNQVLLSDEEAGALNQLVLRNFLPENRSYVYHYFRDNCSTRIRDALDRVTGGVLRETFDGRGVSRSYRWHTRRLVQATLWIDQGLSFLLGTRGDPARSDWEAMFVPMEMMTLLEGARRSVGPDGTAPFLGPREVLYQGSRPPAPDSPPTLSAAWVVLGLGLGGGLVAMGRLARRSPTWGRWALSLAAASWGLFSAGLGGLLVMAWFTDHDFIQRNVNLLHLSPLGLLLAVASLGAAVSGGSGRAQAAALVVASLIVALSLLTALVEATPLLDQGNGEVLAIALPVNTALAWAFWRARAERASRQPAPSRTSPA